MRRLLNFTGFVLLNCLILFSGSCKKDSHKEPKPSLAPRKIEYVVSGTQIRMNYIDSNSVFQKDRLYSGSFHYTFWRGPGTSIGMSVYKQSPADEIFSWELYVDGKLYANAFSEGGVYFNIPYY